MANFYGATALTGGTSGSLDKIDGANLASGDGALVITSTAGYIYYLDAASGAAESSPDVISPDSNAGDKRWVLVDITSEDVIAELLKLWDTDSSNTLTIKWNENDTGNRVLNFLVDGASRSVTLSGDFSIPENTGIHAGSGTFAGATGATVTIGTTLGGTDYHVSVTPTADSEDVGAIYITTKTTTTFKVHCTGSGTPTFDWILIDHN